MWCNTPPPLFFLTILTIQHNWKLSRLTLTTYYHSHYRPRWMVNGKPYICSSVKNDTYVQNDVLRHGRDNLGLPHLHTILTRTLLLKKIHVHIYLKYFINILFFISHNKSIQHCLFLKPNNRSLCKVKESEDIVIFRPRKSHCALPHNSTTTTMQQQLKS